MTPNDTYTLEARLCDDNGMVSHERTPRNPVDPELTYIKQLNNLRSRTPEAAPYTGEPFLCTGSAHLAGMHIRCTNKVHAVPVGLVTTLLVRA